MRNFDAFSPVLRETQTIFDKIKRYNNQKIVFFYLLKSFFNSVMMEVIIIWKPVH